MPNKKDMDTFAFVVKCPRNLLFDFDKICEGQTVNRSEKIREIMRKEVESHKRQIKLEDLESKVEVIQKTLADILKENKLP